MIPCPFPPASINLGSGRDRKPGIARWGALACLLAPLACAGCQSALPRNTAQRDVPAESNAELMEYIGDQAYLTAEPAYRAAHLLGTGQVFEGDYEALQRKLERAGIVNPAWGLQADSYVDRATLGYLLARTADIRTGLNWRLFGLGRYAYRELAYREIAVLRGENSYVSGGEFLGILNRAEHYMKERNEGSIPSAELGAEPGG